MKKIFTSLFLVLSLCAISSLSFPDSSEARRFGGRTSIGRTVTPTSPSTGSSISQQRQTTQSQSNLAGGAAAATNRTGMFGGLFGGLLAGTLLGSLLSGTGFSGGGFLDILLIGGLIYLAYRFFFARGRQNNAQSYRRDDYSQNNRQGGVGAEGGQYGNQGSAWDRLRDTVNGGINANADAQINDNPYSIPSSFDTEGFLSGAKMLYVRMQESWDKRDLEDIREFTSDAFFNEIFKQYQEDPNPSKTELILVQAEVIGVSQGQGNKEANNTQEWVSVLFDVKMREDNQEAEQVKEIWNFGRPLVGSGSWRLEGIQQVA